MQVSNIPSNSAVQQTNRVSNFKQRQQDFQALGKALQDGDLAGARQVFAKLQQDFQNVRRARGEQKTGENDQRSEDFQNLAKALQAGDLTQARQAFAKLQQDFQNVRHAHQPRGAGVSQESNVGQVTPGNGTSSVGGQINTVV